MVSRPSKVVGEGAEPVSSEETLVVCSHGVWLLLAFQDAEYARSRYTDCKYASWVLDVHRAVCK